MRPFDEIAWVTVPALSGSWAGFKQRGNYPAALTGSGQPRKVLAFWWGNRNSRVPHVSN